MDATGTHEQALEYLAVMMSDFMLASGESVRTADVVREVDERVSGSARLVRNELSRLEQDGDFALVDRRYDLASRHTGPRRSVDGLLQAILRETGRPLPLAKLTAEAALRRAVAPEALARTVIKLCQSRDTYFISANDIVGLREWLLDTRPDDTDLDVRRHNFFGCKVDLEAVLNHLDLASAQAEKDDLEAFYVLAYSAQEPLASRFILYALWVARQGQVDVNRTLVRALEDGRFEFLPGPAVATIEYGQEMTRVLRELASQQADDEGQVVATDLHEILAEEGDQFYELSAEDRDAVAAQIERVDGAVSLPDLVSDVLESFPGDQRYNDFVRAMQAALESDERFVPLADNHWHLRRLLPPPLFRVPVTLQPSPITVLSVTGEMVDQPLEDGGLEGGLEWEVRAPDLEDVGEEDEVAAFPEGIALGARQRFVTNYRHFVSGTLKVRKMDRGVFPAEPALRPIPLVDEASGETFELWLNNDSGLLCGLDAWFKDRLQPTGHVFHIEHDTEADVWRASLETDPDPMQVIAQQRLQDLLGLRVQIEHDANTSVLDIMKQLMEHHGGGVSYRRLHAECNIVRRVTKREIASNLSSYPMFSQSEDQTLWLYDERRSSKTRLAEKRAFAIETETETE